MERNLRMLILATIITFVVSWIAFDMFKVPPPQGPLAKAIEKIHETFAMKHCPLLELSKKYHFKTTCKANINSPVVAFAEALATTVFVDAVLGTLLYWRKRLTFVMIGVALLLFLGAAPFEMILEHMELGLILFLISMMVIVEYLSEVGVLGWITIKLVKLSKFKPLRFILIISLLSWLMAALVDEVTSIVFVTKVVLSIAGFLEFNPIPLVIYTVLATNLGSSATMIGNPIGIYIALQSGKTFTEFLEWATPGSLLALMLLVPIGVAWLGRVGLFRRLKEKGSGLVLDEWTALGITSEAYEKYKRGELDESERKRVEEKIKLFKRGWAFFIAVLLVVALHTEIAKAINLALGGLYGLMSGKSIHSEITPDAVLIFGPITIAALVMFMHHEPRELIEKGVEWWTLVFFMFLFAIASALSYTGVTDKMAYALVQSVGGLNFSSTITLTILIAAISAIVSAFLDNMPVVVALSPVVKTLIEIGLPGGDLLWWALLYGATMGGNMTMIGSTANIVALGILEKQGKYVTFWEWFKIGLVAVIITLGGALGLLILHGALVYG